MSVSDDEQSTRRSAAASAPDPRAGSSPDAQPSWGEPPRIPELLAARDECVRQLEDERRRAAELAARAERLEAESRKRDEFLAAMVHELRTPLTPMVTAVQILRGDGGLDERAQRYLAILGRNLEAQASLIDDLAELHRIRRHGIPLEFAAVDLAQVLGRARERVRDRARQRDVGITVDAQSGLLSVWADEVRLEQALCNVLAYAVSQCLEGGSVVLTCTRAASGACIDLHTPRVGPRSTPTVEVFEHPQSAIELGLLLAKHLLEAQAGKLEDTSDSPGALLRVELPMAKASARAPISTTTTEHRALRILLVDDHEDSLLLTRLVLERRGYQVATAGSVQAALRRAAEQRFELLISDIGLPDDSGLTLLPELARLYPIRGIALSGFGRSVDIERSKAAGYVEHLTKPVNMQRLQDIIERLFSADERGSA